MSEMHNQMDWQPPISAQNLHDGELWVFGGDLLVAITSSSTLGTPPFPPLSFPDRTSSPKRRCQSRRAAIKAAAVGGPPVWLAGAALRRTGRAYDGWLPYPPDPKTYVQGPRTIRGIAAEHGRNPDSITPALFATIFVDDDPERGRRALDRYCQVTYRMPLETVGAIQMMLTGPAPCIAAELARYAGARHILLRCSAQAPRPSPRDHLPLLPREEDASTLREV